MIKVLERDFYDHQIILASVYKFDEIKITVVGQDVSGKTLRYISEVISNKVEPKIYPKISNVKVEFRKEKIMKKKTRLLKMSV